MRALDFLLGTSILVFSEADRTKVYQCLLEASASVLSAEKRSDGFSISLLNADAKRLKRSLEGQGVYPTGEKSFGLPVLLRALVRRSGLLLGFALGLALLLFSRSRVWEIELRGSGGIDPDFFLEELSECGLSEGIAFRDFDVESVCFEMQELEKRVSWMQIRREGVRVIVDWIPTKAGDTSIDSPTDRGANLVAEKDAVVVDLQIESGEASVSLGSVVRAGDLLVSGVGTHSAVYARGRIIGRVKERVEVTVPFKSEEIVPLKTECVGFSISLFGYEIPFGNSDGDYTDREAVYLFGKIRLPVFLQRSYRVQYAEKELEHSEADAAKTARRLLSEKLSVLLAEGELVSSSVFASYTEDGYKLTADIEYLINIAKTLEFSLENE